MTNKPAFVPDGNLNEFSSECADFDDRPVISQDFSISCDPKTIDHIEVVLRNLEGKLVQLIKEHSDCLIFGCVAWLTSEPILKELSKCANVQILVQKEDFLRPDLNENNKFFWKNKLRWLYENIRFTHERHQLKDPIGKLSVCCDPTVDAIRCVGNFNRDKKSAFPRSHHKFMVFCKQIVKEQAYAGNHRMIDYYPVALWTGSYNMTFNATMSLENAIIIKDKSGKNKILNAYLNEHHQIFSISESLNWQSDWVEPEFRIGT